MRSPYGLGVPAGRNREEMDMPQPATLTFTVNNFKSLTLGQGIMTTGAGPGADANVALSPSTGTNVTVASNGAVTVAGRTPQVLNLCATGYNPVGLVFKQSGSDPTGRNAFGQYARAANSNMLVVTDNDSAPSTYEFYLLVQKQDTGDFGLIDPLITNS
jgi:hypothetical protein